MEQKNKLPKYKGDGVAIWENTIAKGKNTGKTYLGVKILGGPTVACFEVEEKEESK
jgi:hypothetical protein|tara:strand:+ start:4674 stop:4841 length:168 start_codon:yes stop_codon:yes gene_type:complete